MNKGMRNSKTWKGGLAAELGSHLFVDLTDAIELYELNQKELLYEKWEEIKRQVDIIKGYGFDSLTSEEANEFEKLSLENQLTWIPQFFENMEEGYHKNSIQDMNNICSLLLRFKGSRYTVINKLLQSGDFDKILMKIMNLPENLKIMEAFRAILPRADHNLISSVFTSFIVLLGHSEVHEKFLSLLTESDIHEVIAFILNNKLKCDTEKDGQIQLRSKLYLLVIVLSEGPTRQKYFAVELVQQNNKLMILSAVKDISCSIQALKHVGYSLRELQDAGYR